MACASSAYFNNALTPLGDLISIAFVFGSVAHVEQVRESDVDLMIGGGVPLKGLSAALHSAEQTLAGDPVNAVLFSRAKFRGGRYSCGKPLLARRRPQGEDLPEGEPR